MTIDVEQYVSRLSDEDRFRLLVNAVRDYAIYMLDARGVVSSWNPGAERFKGYAEAEIVGQHFSRFYTEEDRAAGVPTRALATAAETGLFEAEGWRVRKDGSRFWAHVVIDPIRSSEGHLLGFAKITRDLTERRSATEALEKARDALAQAQKMEAIGQLTGGIAHDFNNLLTAIMGSLELARKRAGDDMLRKLIDNAMQAATRGASLTQRMLAFARGQELKPQALDIGRLVRDMKELLERTIGPSISVHVVLADALPLVLMDANQLEMALLNLAINARDAMPEGGVVTISVDSHDAPPTDLGLPEGQCLQLSVADHGCGMSAETLARAKDPFFTTKGVGRGTGLGLSIVHGLAEQSGGRLVLESEIGKGTVATLWLPAAGGGSASSQPTAPSVQTPATHTILTVDDDPLVLFNTSTILEDLGHRVLQASSVKQAQEVLDQSEVDVVIVDYAMPNHTGLDLIEWMLRRDRVPAVVLATGHARIPALPPNVFRLAKPFLQGELVEAISQSLKRLVNPPLSTGPA
ncbi:ATP-binding protein [Reyranella sp.]|uniref:PAS domain-containing sensor histidine kinase n=1 Tax=Reyranella sp. TaxID=1929291 RepID=UPI003BAC1062